MKLDYRVPKQVMVDMTDYIMSMCASFPQEKLAGGRVPSPWTDNLFKVNKKSLLLEPDKAEIFHTFVAQGLFVCKRGRPDVSPAIAFLTTRVKKPTQEDWAKLVRMTKFLNQIANDKLTLKADGTGELKWYVDACCAVHPNFRSHTGATMTMGKGAITSLSSK